jgi:hypothetical protein
VIQVREVTVEQGEERVRTRRRGIAGRNLGNIREVTLDRERDRDRGTEGERDC